MSTCNEFPSRAIFGKFRLFLYGGLAFKGLGQALVMIYWHQTPSKTLSYSFQLFLAAEKHASCSAISTLGKKDPEDEGETKFYNHKSHHIPSFFSGDLLRINIVPIINCVDRYKTIHKILEPIFKINLILHSSQPCSVECNWLCHPHSSPPRFASLLSMLF